MSANHPIDTLADIECRFVSLMALLHFVADAAEDAHAWGDKPRDLAREHELIAGILGVQRAAAEIDVILKTALASMLGGEAE